MSTEAEPQGEPVAWRVMAHGCTQKIVVRADVADELACKWRESDPQAYAQPLYANPPQRQPLTDEQFRAAMERELPGVTVNEWMHIAKNATEQDHGIGEQTCSVRRRITMTTDSTSTTDADSPLGSASSEGLGAWSLIETAPDMPAFSAIVASPMADGGLFVEEAWWDYDRREWWPANVEWTDAHGEQLYPTHWMNLPAPPEG